MVAGGFILSTLSVLPLLFVGQHLVGDSQTERLVVSSIRGLEVVTLDPPGRALAIGPGEQSLLIQQRSSSSGGGLSGGDKEALSLLMRLETQGLASLRHPSEEMGWSIVALNFTAGSLTVVTDG